MAKAKTKGKRQPAEKKFDGGGSRIKAVDTWDEMEGDSEDECKLLYGWGFSCDADLAVLMACPWT